MRPFALALVLMLAISGCATARQQGEAPPIVREWMHEVDRAAPFPAAPIEVLLVATFHFAQQDTTRVDVLSPTRQREIEQVASSLARFRPTRIFIEQQPYFHQRRIDSTYALYRAGQWTLRRNEIYQMGFRIGGMLQHTRVFAADHAGFWLGDSVQRVATKLGQRDILDATAPRTIKGVHEVTPNGMLLSQGSIGEVLRWQNDPQYQLRIQNNYFGRLARIGDDNAEAGPDLVAEWYRRNIKIYRAVIDQLDYSEPRILVIIGGDHIPPLQHFFESNVNFRVVPALRYLP